jgi:hypothetical protein
MEALPPAEQFSGNGSGCHDDIDMSELGKRILFTVVTAPISAVIGFFVQKTLSSSGILDQFAEDFGRWLKMNFSTSIDTDVVLWGVSSVLSLSLYGICLFFIWKNLRTYHVPSHSVRPAAVVTTTTSLEPQPDMTVKEAAEHVAQSSSDVGGAASHEVWRELRQAARYGRMAVWGRPESAHLERPFKPMERIDPDHWRHYDFAFLRCMHSEDEARCRSEPDDPKRYPLNKGYADLRVNATQVRTSWIAKISSDALTIEIGDGAPFNTYVERLHTKTHLIRIGVVNGIQDKAVTNCQLRLEHITGPSSDRCPVIIKQNFTINGGATEYIPLVEFVERIDKATPAPSRLGRIRLHFPLTRPLSNGISYLDAGSYELTLMATSAETPPARQKCRLMLADGFLNLQRL